MRESPKQDISSIKTNAHIRSFHNLSFQSDIVYLNLSNNLFFDFIGFNPPKKLKTLIMNDNPILSFEGFPEDETSNLEEISLINCPISRLGNFRSLCIIVIGRQLKMINGVKVTRNDQNIALRFGTDMGTNDSKIIRFLLTSGWLPKRSAILDNDSLDSIMSSLEKQKNDPISLKSVSKLREIGYSKPEIKKLIRLYFSPDSMNENIKRKNNSIISEKTQQQDPIETQLQKQQELINTLSFQIQLLRNGNKSFNAYDEMIKTIGAPLIANAKIVNDLNTDKQNDVSDSKTNTNSKLKENDDYAELRRAAIELIDESDSIDDNILIEKLSELIPGNDEEDQNEENNEEDQNEENNEEDQNEENNEEDQNEENNEEEES